MDSLRKLRVVLWKNLLIRKRHKLLTLVEIVIPIVLFLFVSYARSRIPDFSKHYVNESTVLESTHASDIATRLNIRELKVLYAPKTDFTKNLLRQVQLKLSLYNEGVQGFRDEHDLIAHYDKYGGEGVTAAILFSNVDNLVPTKLVYDIRLYEDYVFWNTDKLFLHLKEYVPGIGSETYKDKGFLPLQMALDTSFFELVSKNAPNLTLAFQEFPYPPYTMDSGLHAMFIHALPILTLFSFLFMWPSILKRIIEEKSSGIKELMKLNGLEPWMMWASWFIYGFVLNIISAVVIVLFLKLKLWHESYPAVQFCNGVILGVYLLLYCSACISFCFLFSIPFKRPNLAMIIGILFWIIGFLLYSNFARKTDVFTWSIKIPSLLFPNIALHYGYQAISMFELREIHLGFANLFESPTGSSNDISMGNILLMLLFDTVFYFILSIYLDNLYPGPYGISRKWTYPLQGFHKLRRRNSVMQDTPDKLPLTHKPGLVSKIKIQDLKKTYSNKTVVNGLKMDIYEGQITGLLGHNGAGKTTTISILTGMVEATSGKVLIHMGGEDNYVDLKENFRSIRHMLSVCPQHNLLFPDLTVLEHLKFFGMLRGSLSSDASKQALDLLSNKLYLFHKKDKLVHTLSGGMKRKLALGMALMGNPEILILDEPTAGVDIEGRRELWDLILPYKKEKTILITTHFMEEADHLADRIAIMDHGNLVCYETPMKLKLDLDVGYYLMVNRMLVNEQNINKEVKELTEKIKHIMRDYEVECSSISDAPKFADETEELAEKISDVVKDYKVEGTKDAFKFASQLKDFAAKIRDGSKSAHEVEGLIEKTRCTMKDYDGRNDDPKVKETIMNILKVYDVKHKFTYKYRLPNDEKSKITRLLCQIEDESAKVRELYGDRELFSFKLCHTTLEDVFLNVGNKAANQVGDTKSSICNDRVSPGTTTWHKFRILVNKRLLFMRKKKLLFLAMVFITTLIIALVFNLGGSGSTDTSQDGPTLNLDLNVYGETGVYYSSTSSKTGKHYEQLIKQQRSVPMKVDNVLDAIIEKGIENIAYYKQRMIVGAKFMGHHGSRTEHVDVMYSNSALHGAPISLNLVMNTMLKMYAGEDHSIVASNTPLHSVVNKQARLEQTEIINLVMWFILFPLAPLFIISYIISFTHAEESSNIRRLQHICGVSPRLYWITNLIWDVLYYLTAMGLSLLVLYVLASALGFFGVNLFGNYLLFGAQEFGMLALILVVYACSVPWAYWTSYVHKTVESAYSTYLLLNISVFPILTICVLVMEISGDKHYEQVSVVLRYVFAFFPQFSLTHMASKFSRKFVQNNNWDVKSEKEKRLVCSYDSLPCCAPESDQCRDHRSYFTDLDFLYVTLVTTCLSLLLLMWFDTIRFMFKSLVLHLPFRGGYKDTEPSNSQPEGGDVKQKHEGVDEKQKKILDVKSIRQKYLTPRSWPPWKEIIKKISFNVMKGECVGLLGVNGAGKSTTFRILAGEEKPVDGSVTTDDKSIYEFTGYCPQQDALIDELTGRELLTIFANLRGETSPEESVNLWFTAFNMLEYADQPCGKYSGGNKRKLNTCLSLIGVPPLVVLDEPTSGVDPKSRRIVWNVLSQIKKAQTSAIVLSSHSMDECEALCDKLIIIKDGKIEREGPILKLQQDHSGFTVKIKVKTDKDVIDYNNEHRPTNKNQKRNSTASSSNSNNESEPLNKAMEQSESEDEEVQTLLEELLSRFDCKEVDEHQGLLHIQVKNNKWSDIFRHLEDLKSSRSDIEDYTVSDSSLEDLFLDIAKANKREQAVKDKDKESEKEPVVKKRKKERVSKSQGGDQMV